MRGDGTSKNNERRKIRRNKHVITREGRKIETNITVTTKKEERAGQGASNLKERRKNQEHGTRS